LLIVLVGILFLNPLWTPHEIVYSKHSDLINEHLAIKEIGRRAIWQEGAFPLWNPSMNGGAPAFANPQAMYAFPFDLLFFVLPLDLAANLVILLNVLLAGISMYLFSRLHVRHHGSAVFCATAYMLSYRYLAMIYAGWLPKLSMYALMPLLFWACAKLLRQPDRRTMALFSIVAALALMQGDMQQLYYGGIGCGLYVLCRLRTIDPRKRLTVAGHLALGCLFAAMLSAPVLLPRLEFASLSTRTAPNYQFSLNNPPAFSDLITWFDPLERDKSGAVRHEFWENNFYFGYWLIPFCMLALRRQTRGPWFILASLAVMVLLCFDTFLLRWTYDHVPGFHLFRQSPRILLLAQFAMVTLAGLGVDAFLSEPATKSIRTFFLFCVLFTVAIAVAMTLHSKTYSLLPVTALLSLIGLLIFLQRPTTLLISSAILACPVLDSAVRIEPLLSTKPLAEVVPHLAVHDFLKRGPNAGRVLAIGRSSIPYSMAGLYEVDLVNANASLELKHYIEYFSILQYGTRSAVPNHPVIWTDCRRITRPELLRALDVRYIVGNPPLELASIGAKKIGDYPQTPVFVFYVGMQSLPVEVWSLDHPLGPAYFATSVRGVETESESLANLESATSVLDACAIGLDRGLAPFDLSGGTATMVHCGINRYDYRIDSHGINFLILSQIWYPGWTATLDGQETKLYRTNHALLGCVIPAGSHQLVLRMICTPLRYGLGASLTAAVGLIILLWRRTAPIRADSLAA
jgi:hypothetical protein